MRSVREEILCIEEVIGAGEIAIADERANAHDAPELAKLVKDAYVGGLLSRKCGVKHFHVGEVPSRLNLLRALIDEYEINPALLYPTHVERDEELMREAIELSARLLR